MPDTFQQIYLIVSDILLYLLSIGVFFSQYFLRAGALGAFVVDPGAAALRAVELAHLPGVTREPPPVAVLALDAGLAGRLGVRISPAPGVELR